MGTLADITSKAVNRKFRHEKHSPQTSKGTPSRSENDIQNNFMTPTMASSKKVSTPPTSRVHSRVSTPSSMSIEKTVTGKWMTSAAKRVGLRRFGDGTPRSRKEGLKQGYNAVTFPDKLSTSPQSPTILPSRLDSPAASILNDKPLPSPPVAQVKVGYAEEARSLIDASEKPLQRTSPRSPQLQEEWPVLSPQKSITTNTVQHPLQQDAHHGLAQVVSNDNERYPLLSGSRAVSSPQPKLTSKIPSSHKFQRRAITAVNRRDSSSYTSPLTRHESENRGTSIKRAMLGTTAASSQPKAMNRLSAEAASIEKFSSDGKVVKEPRQTRTSSLRARISAGQIIRDSPNKILGFTDFTAEKAPSAQISNEVLGSNASVSTRTSTSFGKAFTKKPSNEFQANRAPAQFVAGSRRPSARRPSSRNSLRSDSRAQSPAFFEPSRPAPPAPTGNAGITVRKSSIPISRNSILPTATKANVQRPTADESTRTEQASTSFDAPSFSETYQTDPISSTKEQDRKIPAHNQFDDTSVLESIVESPRSTFRSKRLSTKSSSYGPKLTISSSADRIILGEAQSAGENEPLIQRKKSIDLFRAAISNDHKNAGKHKAMKQEHKKPPARPFSSQGFAENKPRVPTETPTRRAKKVNSVDMGSVSSATEADKELAVVRTDVGPNTEHETSNAAEDPVFEIETQAASRTKTIEKPGANSVTSVSRYDPTAAPTISDVDECFVPVIDAMPVAPASLPETVREYINKPSKVSNTTGADVVQTGKDKVGMLHVDTNLQQVLNKETPSTPQHETQKTGSPSSINFPPRSSSRMQHPNYTINGSAKSSPVSSSDPASASSQAAMSATQAGKSKPMDEALALQSSNVDRYDPSHREISSQTILADVQSKRGSTAHESMKSQTSVTKGLMSNFRGLFHHKRNHEDTGPPHARSTKKGAKRPTVTAHGSPFPSMSNIHPVHRPTQATTNRSVAAARRTSPQGVPTTTSPATPSLASPVASEVSTTTAMAMEILESARHERSSPKKERLLELGKMMVNTITQAREAEKAMEEAKQAARKAEVAHALCKKSVSDVAGLVKEWRVDVR